MMRTSMAYNDIWMRFIRGNGLSAETDDTLVIAKRADQTVTATYREWNKGPVSQIDTQTLTYPHLFAYLWRIFWIVGMDDDPFVEVQFNIPGYPCFLVSVAKLQANLTPIMELLMSTVWSWPDRGT